MSLTYEPSSEPLHISEKQFFLELRTCALENGGSTRPLKPRDPSREPGPSEEGPTALSAAAA